MGIPVVQVRGSSLLFYDEPVRLYNSAVSVKRQLNMSRQQEKQYSGGMSQGSRKRMAKAITVMSQAVKGRWKTNPATGQMMYHKFTFLTLTVSSPENITARQGYDGLLSHFLDWLTRTKGVKTYIWKAELQKRGQLHYHITSPALIHWREVRDKWNDLQRRAGLLDQYALEHGHFDPNSTDIHNTKQVKNADRYLLKELNKSISAIQVEAISEVNKRVADGELDQSEAQEEIERIKAEKIKTVGKIWGCSNDLQGVGYYTIPVTSQHEQLIDHWVREGKARRTVDDFFSIVYCDNVDPPDLLSVAEEKGFTNYLKWVLDRNADQNEIPEACVQMELVDVCMEYPAEQLILFLN